MNDIIDRMLVKAKVKVVVPETEELSEMWDMGYIAPLALSNKGPAFKLITLVPDEVVWRGGSSGDFSAIPKRYSSIIWETVGRYIGLKDKNGRRIFEGDIVKYYCYGVEYQDKYELKLVEWVDECCGFEPFSDSLENCGHCGGGLEPNLCEVIGNIHDDPEFLKTQIDKGNDTMQQINSIREYYFKKTKEK